MENILEIKDLTVSYGTIPALKGISMNVPKGKIVVMLGANGAGKTTMMRTISGVVRAGADDETAAAAAGRTIAGAGPANYQKHL